MNDILREAAESGTDQRVTIAPTALGERGHRYRVTYADGTLIEGSRVPALDACRALLALGITGKLEVWRPGKEWPDMQLDIERGAQLTVEESDRQAPRFVRWRAREDLSKCPARVGGVGQDAREGKFPHHPLSETAARPGAVASPAAPLGCIRVVALGYDGRSSGADGRPVANDAKVVGGTVNVSGHCYSGRPIAIPKPSHRNVGGTRRCDAPRRLPCVGDAPLDGLAISRLDDAIELHYARSRCDPQSAGDISGRMNETDALPSSPDRKAKALRELHDVWNGIAMGQAREMAQRQNDLLEENAKRFVMPNSGHPEHGRFEVF